MEFPAPLMTTIAELGSFLTLGKAAAGSAPSPAANCPRAAAVNGVPELRSHPAAGHSVPGRRTMKSLTSTSSLGEPL